MSDKKQKALKLDLPGAPLNWHTVHVDAGEEGSWRLPGHYHPEIATPLGEIGEATAEQARAAIKAGAHVKFTDISDKQAEESRKALAEHDAIAKNIVRDALRSGDPELAERAQAQA